MLANFQELDRQILLTIGDEGKAVDLRTKTDMKYREHISKHLQALLV